MENRKKLIEIYLDYRNNYLTVEKIAEHNGLHIAMMQVVLDAGKYCFEGNHIDK